MDTDWRLSCDVPADVLHFCLERQSVNVLDPREFDEDEVPAITPHTDTSTNALHILQGCAFTAHQTIPRTAVYTEEFDTQCQQYNSTDATQCMYSTSPEQTVPLYSSSQYVHSDQAVRAAVSGFMQIDSSGETDHSSLESNNQGEVGCTADWEALQAYPGGQTASSYCTRTTYGELPASEESNDSVELPSSRDLGVTMDISETIQGSPISPRLPSFRTILHKTTEKRSRRGRPVTFPKPGSNYSSSEEDSVDDDDDGSTSSHSSPSKRRGAKSILLWKFLLDELSNPKEASHIEWVNAIEGIFRFVDTNEVSRRWGMKKNKTDMNFEKLSRGIRHYYKDGLMSRQERTRLVYKFNWDRVPRAYRKF